MDTEEKEMGRCGSINNVLVLLPCFWRVNLKANYKLIGIKIEISYFASGQIINQEQP